jgi:hypothetical protein
MTDVMQGSELGCGHCGGGIEVRDCDVRLEGCTDCVIANFFAVAEPDAKKFLFEKRWSPSMSVGELSLMELRGGQLKAGSPTSG